MRVAQHKRVGERVTEETCVYEKRAYLLQKRPVCIKREAVTSTLHPEHQLWYVPREIRMSCVAYKEELCRV